MVNAGETKPSKFRQTVEYSRETITMLRDASLLFIFLLLLLWPEKVNEILVRAGFEEGSVAGFTWKSNLDDSNIALQKAEATIANLQAKLEQQRELLQKASEEIVNPKQKEDIEQLNQATQELTKATQQTQMVVSQAIDSNTPLLDKSYAKLELAAKSDSTRYLVGLQTLGIDERRRRELNKELVALGYKLDELSYAYPAGERPGWFATSNTVFYYSSRSRTAAQTLASRMQQLTGVSFKVQLGAGLGVSPDLKAVTLFVHYLSK